MTSHALEINTRDTRCSGSGHRPVSRQREASRLKPLPQEQHLADKKHLAEAGGQT